MAFYKCPLVPSQSYARWLEIREKCVRTYVLDTHRNTMTTWRDDIALCSMSSRPLRPVEAFSPLTSSFIAIRIIGPGVCASPCTVSGGARRDPLSMSCEMAPAGDQMGRRRCAFGPVDVDVHLTDGRGCVTNVCWETVASEAASLRP